MDSSDMSVSDSIPPEKPPRPFRRRERPTRVSTDPADRMGVGFNPLETIRQTERNALLDNDLLPTRAQLWFDQGVGFAWELADARKLRDYNDDLGKCVFIIFTKAMNDFLATAHLSRSGYHLPAFGSLRGGLEATELLEYLIVHPGDVKAWMNKAKRFDRLGWIRKQLPKAAERSNVYDVINNVFHCNVLESLSYMSRTQEDGRKNIFTGPMKLDPDVITAFDLLSSSISYPVRVLWQHNPTVASCEWVRRFHQFDKALNFPFADPWVP